MDTTASKLGHLWGPLFSPDFLNTQEQRHPTAQHGTLTFGPLANSPAAPAPLSRKAVHGVDFRTYAAESRPCMAPGNGGKV